MLLCKLHFLFAGAPVRLNSSSPFMVVKRVKNKMAECVWFDGEVREMKFPVKVLTFGKA